MHPLLLVTLSLVLALLAHHLQKATPTHPFELWKQQFPSDWPQEQELYRQLIFEHNVQQIQKHNQDHSQTYKKGINQFTVYSQKEFAQRFLMQIPLPPIEPQEEAEVIASNGDIDWSTKGMVSRVKNQGQCGSCWAFSATGALESYFFIRGLKTADLSEQQLVDCSRPQGNQGCNGGWPSNAFQYIQSYGLAGGSEYPYIGHEQSCLKTGGSWRISKHSTYKGCSGIIIGIMSNPIAITVDASNWMAYRSGVFNNCHSNVNHAVLLVGFVGGTWKVKNSWSNTWGENGYIRLQGGNTCGLCNFPGISPA